MKNSKCILILIAVSLAFLTNCTSGESGSNCEEGTDCVVEGGVKPGDGEVDATAKKESDAENPGGEKKPEDAMLDEAPKVAGNTDEKKLEDDLLASDAAPKTLDEKAKNDGVSALKDQPGIDPGTPLATDTPVAVEPAPVGSQVPETPVVENKSKNIPLQKIATVPFQKGSKLMNAVYIARNTDTVEGIATRIFGAEKVAEKTEELKEANGFLKNRDSKVGDKIYYHSPKRPTDDVKLLTYYEDEGIAPASYIAKKGDSLQRVAKNLLGDELSWKEIWATNGVEGKFAVPEGTEIKYWGTDAVPVAVAAGGAGGAATTRTAASETGLPPKHSDTTAAGAVGANDPNAPKAPPVEVDPAAQAAQAAADKVAADQRAAADKVAADQRAAADKVAADQRAAAERAAAKNPDPGIEEAQSHKSGLDAILNDPTTLGAIGAGVVVLFLLVLVLAKKKKATSEAEAAFDEKTQAG